MNDQQFSIFLGVAAIVFLGLSLGHKYTIREGDSSTQVSLKRQGFVLFLVLSAICGATSIYYH